MIDFVNGALILVLISIVLFYFLQSNNVDKNPWIPYVNYKNYPIVGHVFPFLSDRKKFLLECQQRYGKYFKLQVFNKKMIAICSPADWTLIVRNQGFYFPVNNIVKEMFDATIDITEQPEFYNEAQRQYTQYLKNSDGLRPMIIEFTRRIRQEMQNERTAIHTNSKLSEWIPTGLLELSHRMTFSPSTLALFGEIPMNPLENDFRLFDKNIHYFGASIPRRLCSWLFSKTFMARTRINQLWLTNDFDSIQQSQLMQVRRELLMDYSDRLTERDIGALQTSLFWASLGNTIPAIFWCLYFILQDDNAKEVIIREIDTNLPKFSLDDNNADDESIIEQWTPERLNSCIYLDSAINEVLRLNAAPLMTRRCYQETDIRLHDGQILHVEPSTMLMHFVGNTHMDDKLFSESDRFIFDRFVQKNVDSLPGFMPFGGGKSICPGRFFAKNEMKICVVMLLRYMDYKFIDTKNTPKQKEARIGFGVAPPDQDVPIVYRYKN